MDDNSKVPKKITRRGLIPLLGSSLLIPFLGFGNTSSEDVVDINNEEYKTLLKPDGTTVKVKISTIKKSKVVSKNLSNKSFFNWLGKKH